MNLLRTAWRLLRHPRSLQKQLGLLLSYLLFRVRYPFARAKRSEETNGVALIVNLSDAPHRAITEGIFGGAVRRAGAEPVIVTGRGYRWLEWYSRALGINRFAYIEDYRQPSYADADAALIDTFLAGRPGTRDILAFRIGSIQIGLNALSTVLKRVRRGSVDLEDPATRAMVRGVLVEAAAAVRTADTLLADLQPRLLIFNEAGYTPYGELFALAVQNGLNAVQYVHSHRLDAFVLKRYKSTENMVDPVSLSPASWAHIQTLPWNAAQEKTFMQELCGHYEHRTWFTLILSKKKQHLPPDVVRKRLGLDPTKKTVVVFSHVVWDASFFFGENLFDDYDEWLVETVRAARDNPHVNWVIKLHPDYVWHTKDLGGDADMRDMIAIRAGIGSLPDHIRIVPPTTDISTYSFFAVTDYCVTVRGTIGVECPCFGIPVFTAGTGRYWGFGFTEDSATREEYVAKMRTIHETPPLSPERQSLARKHAWALFTLHVIPCPSIELVPIYDAGGDVIDHRTAIHARSARDIETDPGLRTIGEWTLHSSEEDYLASTKGYTDVP